MLEGKIPVNQQVAAVVLVGGAPDNTFIFPLDVITPSAPGGVVLLPSFITDSSKVSNPVSMLYWLETDPTTNTAKARYKLFLGAGAFPTPAQDLSASFPTITVGLGGITPTPVGDYMKGGSYRTTDSANNVVVNFVPVWPQSVVDGAGNVTMNVWTRVVPVSLGPGTTPFTPPNTSAPPKAKAPLKTSKRLPCEMCTEAARRLAMPRPQPKKQ
jgi:hypothetical protein